MSITIIRDDPETGMEATVFDGTLVLGTVDDCSAMEWVNPATPFEVRDMDFECIGYAATVDAAINMIRPATV